MPKPIDINEILKLNPDLDREEIQAATELNKQLKDMGLERRDYCLGTHIRVRVDQESDSRATHLRSCKSYPKRCW